MAHPSPELHQRRDVRVMINKTHCPLFHPLRMNFIARYQFGDVLIPSAAAEKIARPLRCDEKMSGANSGFTILFVLHE